MIKVENDGQYNFITQRQYPILATVTPQLDGKNLRISAPSLSESILVPLTLNAMEGTSEVQARVWKHIGGAYDMGDEPAAWFSKLTGMCQFNSQSRVAVCVLIVWSGRHTLSACAYGAVVCAAHERASGVPADRD